MTSAVTAAICNASSPFAGKSTGSPRVRRMRGKRLLAMAVVAACLPLAATVSEAAAPSVASHNFATRNLEPTGAILLTFSENAELLAGRIAVFIGPTDVTATLRLSGADVNYGPSPLGLPLGANDVVVMFYDGTTWAELARLPLIVAAAGAPVADAAATTATTADTKKSGFTPKIDLTGAAGITRTEFSGKPNTTVNTHSGGLQGSIANEWSGDDYGGWLIKAQANAAGSSVRSQALRFAQRASAAEKVDLASYLLEGNVGGARFALGHVTAGSHPLLMNGLSFRGATVSYPISPNFDVTLNAHNGTAIVGFDRTFGVYDDTHHFAGATLGYEVYPATRGRLRFEVAALDASVSQSQPGINTSPTLSTQESAGVGLRVLGQTEDARGRFDAAYATSRYRSIGDGLTPTTAATSRSAYLFDGSYQALRAVELSPRWPLTTTFTLKHEYADPLYKSLGAGYGADYQQTAVGAQSTLGPLSAQLTASVRNDNVKQLATALTNKVTNASLTFSGGIAQIFDIKPAPLIPTANLTFLRTHQWGTRAPTTLDPMLIPNIATDAVNVGLNWSGETWTLSLTGGINKQDNRQIGSENKDIRTQTFGAQGSWRASEKLNFTVGISPNVSRQSDTGLRRTTWNPNAGITWQLPWDIALTSAANFDRSFDSQAINGTRSWGFSNQIAKTFKVPVGWGTGTQTVQVSLRQFVSYAYNRTQQGLVDTQSSTRSSGVLLNVSISLF